MRAFLKKHFEHRALVLMYHRVSASESDIWDIAVSPENFEQQLQVLRRTKNVIPLQELAEGIKQGKVPKNSVAITFDDGYVDNFLVAKPLLEKYWLPATFFITSVNIGKTAEFWWDELEYLLLFSEHLPQQLDMTLNGNRIVFDLLQETALNELLRQQNNRWKACDEAPPTRRSELFYTLWEAIKPLPDQNQQEVMAHIRQWAGATPAARPEYQSMSEAQLLELHKSPLLTVGAHTASHPALAFHAPAYQQQELLRNTQYLQKLTGRQPNLLAYPYGNYNKDTIAVAAEMNFLAAFTTEEKPVTHRTPLYSLGRVQAKNWDATAFSAMLNQWK